MSAVLKHSTEARYARLTDAEVVLELWDAIGDVEGDVLSDRLYWLTGELLERFAREAEWAAAEFEQQHNEDKELNLEGHREALERRRRVREIFAEANRKLEAIDA